MLGIVSLLQTLVDEGEVAEDGVHRHHAPAHGRHHHRVHPCRHKSDVKQCFEAPTMDFFRESTSYMNLLTDVGPDVEEDRLRVLVHGLHNRGHLLLLPDPGPQDPPGHILVHPGVLHTDRGFDPCIVVLYLFL